MSGFLLENDWTTAAGLRAVVIFGSMGHRCGYVAVPEGHPLFGVSYNSHHPATLPLWKAAQTGGIGKRGIIPLFCMTDEEKPQLDVVFDVHGSLTYSAGSSDYPVESSGLWWFGFDAGHCDGRDNPKSLDYMMGECESLATQLAWITAEMPV